VKKINNLSTHLIPRTQTIIEKAESYSNNLIEKIELTVNEYCKQNAISLKDLCFILVGSIGRREALEASDIDLIPVFRNNISFESYDKGLRDYLSKKLKIKVSSGEQLTKVIGMDALTDPQTIGGDKDSSPNLTKRILILTEGIQAGGNYKIEDVKRKILESYHNSEVTK
jgi:predicted nucleotidyltransferase